MFTGLIQHVGVVSEIVPIDTGLVLVIDPLGWKHRPREGDSIAVNGCCLTVATDPGIVPDGQLMFDCVRQTLEVTSLGRLREGDRVNLEHALRPTDFLGGHVVQGHVDGVGQVESVMSDPMEHRVRIRAPRSIAEYLIDKGSITVDGVSLTLARVGPEWFEVALIPTTLEVTTLSALQPERVVNLEVDLIAKTVVSWLRRCGFEPGEAVRTIR
jgi:riboflavin synthase